MMTQALNEMRATAKDVSEKGRRRFLKAFASFGQGMLTNRFTFRSGMVQMPNSSLDINFSISGERLSNFKMNTTIPIGTNLEARY